MRFIGDCAAGVSDRSGPNPGRLSRLGGYRPTRSRATSPEGPPRPGPSPLVNFSPSRWIRTGDPSFLRVGCAIESAIDHTILRVAGSPVRSEPSLGTWKPYRPGPEGFLPHCRSELRFVGADTAASRWLFLTHGVASSKIVTEFKQSAQSSQTAHTMLYSDACRACCASDAPAGLIARKIPAKADR